MKLNPDPTPGDMQERDRYFAMLSHDLRSAITGIIGSLGQIDEKHLTPEAAGHRDSAILAAHDASHLLDDIWDLEAIEKDAFALDLTVTCLPEILSDLHRRWSSRAAAKSVTLNLRHAPDLPTYLKLDRGRVMRVIGNLLENAIKYTDRGSITLAAERIDDRLRIRVSDSGPGFSASALKMLFQFKGRPADAVKPGSGLGLYTAKTLLDQMDGKIDVGNSDGAVVALTIPIIEPDDDDESGGIAVFPGPGVADLAGVNVLFAEDNLTNQLVVTQMLTAMGATFDVAADGFEALHLFEHGTYDLVLLDIEMPRISGLDVIRTIRGRNDDRRDAKVVALTAYAMREHREKITEAGADGMIAKPILGLEEFGNAILRHVQPKSKPVEDAERPEPIDSQQDTTAFVALEKSIGREMMAELMEKVVIDLEDVRSGINAGIAKQDMQPIKSASHVLISVAGAIGMQKTQHAAEALNRAANRADEKKVGELSASCLTGIDEILKLIRNRE